jgi:hypothetical protein
MSHGVKYLRVEKVDGDDKCQIILQENGGREPIGDLLIEWGRKDLPERKFFLKYKFLLTQIRPIDNAI